MNRIMRLTLVLALCWDTAMVLAEEGAKTVRLYPEFPDTNNPTTFMLVLSNGLPHRIGIDGELVVGVSIYTFTDEKLSDREWYGHLSPALPVPPRGSTNRFVWLESGGLLRRKVDLSNGIRTAFTQMPGLRSSTGALRMTEHLISRGNTRLITAIGVEYGQPLFAPPWCVTLDELCGVLGDASSVTSLYADAVAVEVYPLPHRKCATNGNRKRVVPQAFNEVGEDHDRKREETRVDLGGGVEMEFVWIGELGCWVGRYEVTNGEYRRFKREHTVEGEAIFHWKLNKDRQPVAMVSYSNAVAFAEWINSTAKLPEGYRARLPDGREWTTFAQCGDGRRFPWGSAMPPGYGNYGGRGPYACFGARIQEFPSDRHPVTCVVEESGRNKWGLYGVGGNVAEWTGETYVTGGGVTCLTSRGGSWLSRDTWDLLIGNSASSEPSFRTPSIGFRLVLSK